MWGGCEISTEAKRPGTKRPGGKTRQAEEMIWDKTTVGFLLLQCWFSFAPVFQWSSETSGGNGLGPNDCWFSFAPVLVFFCSSVGFLLLQCSSGVVQHPRDLQVSVATHCFCRVLIFVSS